MLMIKILFNFTEACFQEPNWQWTSISSDDGLPPNRRQAITWTNVDPVHRRIYAGDELRDILSHLAQCYDGYSINLYF